MSDQPLPPRRGPDAIALTLCAVGLFLGFSLFGQTGPDRFTRPIDDEWTSMPSQLRFQVFDTLGLASYLFLMAWFVVSAIRFRRPRLPLFARRILGWAILVTSAAVIADRLGTQLGGPIVGSGGSVGASGSIWLDQNCSPFLSLLLIAAAMFVGLLLAADPVVGALWRTTAAVVRFLFATIEGTFNAIATIFEKIAVGFRVLARRIGCRPHPVRNLSASTTSANAVSVPLWKPEISPAPTIPIHHHRRSSPIRNGTESTPIGTFPRAMAEPVEEPVPPRPYDLPSLDLLDEPVTLKVENQDERLRDVAIRLEKAFADFGLSVKVVGIHTGPVITQFEIALDTGLRVSKITSLSDDLALHLRVSSVRIVAPIPGKNTVGIEVPNEQRVIVRMKELAVAGAAKIAKAKLPLLLGKDSEGRPLVHDLAEMPHLLIAGRTGTGKSVCLNSIILSLLLTRRPDECKLIMLDPKQVELAEYGRLPHLMHPVVTDNKKAEAILSWAVDKMEERYEILRRARVRNIAGYNELSYTEILKRVKPVDDDEKTRVPPRMPYIVIVVDEVGDLMMAMKKEVEGHIIRLAQKSRAAGIHLILTTQRPTVDIITGLIKSNMPARICFQVADRSNSRVVLDEMGAEKLLGKGDMLFLQPNTSTIVRAQGVFASDDEIQRIVGLLEVERPTYDSELLGLQDQETTGKGCTIDAMRKRDEVYEEAIEIVVREGRGSVSLLQRALGIGYGRAARLIDYMAEDGIVGTFNGGQARDVLFTAEQWEDLKKGGSSALAESA